ncbi:M48 family metalloprotease [Nocardia goodfellowii]|uniref:STE24 endopeptidase n=1 Tax=Nocardia goodfellowii TaxID=882446 RepID=A0ABS4Q6F8_9NOCA|nr:M48 family metalloprotease [Nocardia goodfellowii]MBP2187285.1 STE24 endopeptidase [Nocardia goodfellowii]
MSHGGKSFGSTLWERVLAVLRPAPRGQRPEPIYEFLEYTPNPLLWPVETWRHRLESAAVLVVSLPSIVLSTVLVCVPFAVFGWWGALTAGTLWLASGALAFLPADDAVLARVAYGFRRPRPQEQAVLAVAWENVTQAAGVDGSDYALWVQDSEDLNAFAAPGGIVCVTTWALHTLDSRQLEGVLAHELGHHLEGKKYTATLARWYSVPVKLIGRVLGFGLTRALAAAEREAEEAPGLALAILLLGGLGSAALVLIPLVAALLLLIGPLAALTLLALLGIAEPLGRARLSQREELRADRVAVDLGYGRECREVHHEWLGEHDDSPLAGYLHWLSTHPPADTRIEAVEARIHEHRHSGK